MTKQHRIALITAGLFLALASYCYGRYKPAIMKTVWANSEAEQIAEVWGLTPESVAEPVELWGAK